MLQLILVLLLGLVAGTASGLIGIGGGIIIVPSLVFIFGLTQHQAQGTTLALMVPPIGFLAAYTYWKAGHVDLKIAAFVCAGFFIGGLIGSKIAVEIPETLLQKIFGGLMIVIGIYMIIRK